MQRCRGALLGLPAQGAAACADQRLSPPGVLWKASLALVVGPLWNPAAAPPYCCAALHASAQCRAAAPAGSGPDWKRVTDIFLQKHRELGRLLQAEEAAQRQAFQQEGGQLQAAPGGNAWGTGGGSSGGAVPDSKLVERGRAVLGLVVKYPAERQGAMFKLVMARREGAGDGALRAAAEEMPPGTKISIATSWSPGDALRQAVAEGFVRSIQVERGVVEVEVFGGSVRTAAEEEGGGPGGWGRGDSAGQRARLRPASASVEQAMPVNTPVRVDVLFDRSPIQRMEEARQSLLLDFKGVFESCPMRTMMAPEGKGAGRFQGTGLRDILFGDSPGPRANQPSLVLRKLAQLRYDAPDGRPPGAGDAKWRPLREELRDMVCRSQYVQGLNKSQLQAVCEALERRATLVQGPPGTGKTRCIVAFAGIVKRDLPFSLGGPLLLCAQSNTAADNLAEACAARGLEAVRVGVLSRMRPRVAERLSLDAVMEERMRQDPSALGLKHELMRMAGKERAGSREQQALDDLQGRVQQEVLRGCDVVVSTNAGAGCLQLEWLRFPLVVADEAAQCNVLELLPALAKGSEQMVLVGDPQQLPPIVHSEEGRAAGLQVSAMQRLMEAGVWKSLLGQQYRMHPAIARLANQLYYNNQLSDGITAADRPLGLPLLLPDPDHPAIFLQVDGREQRPAKEGFSRRNSAEAEVVLELVDWLLAHGASADDIGIITPYAAQVDWLKRCFRKRGYDTPHAHGKHRERAGRRQGAEAAAPSDGDIERSHDEGTEGAVGRHHSPPHGHSSSHTNCSAPPAPAYGGDDAIAMGERPSAAAATSGIGAAAAAGGAHVVQGQGSATLLVAQQRQQQAPKGYPVRRTQQGAARSYATLGHGGRAAGSGSGECSSSSSECSSSTTGDGGGSGDGSSSSANENGKEYGGSAGRRLWDILGEPADELARGDGPAPAPVLGGSLPGAASPDAAAAAPAGAAPVALGAAGRSSGSSPAGAGAWDLTQALQGLRPAAHPTGPPQGLAPSGSAGPGLPGGSSSDRQAAAAPAAHVGKSARRAGGAMAAASPAAGGNAAAAAGSGADKDMELLQLQQPHSMGRTRLARPMPEIMSVDGYQGREKDIIILTTVRANERGLLGFLDDPCRTNVAITRARKLLVVVGDQRTLRREGSWDRGRQQQQQQQGAAASAGAAAAGRGGGGDSAPVQEQGEAEQRDPHHLAALLDLLQAKGCIVRAEEFLARLGRAQGVSGDARHHHHHCSSSSSSRGSKHSRPLRPGGAIRGRPPHA